jgi:16S rRNA (cytidine1402-2'-O)-methyltransferase
MDEKENLEVSLPGGLYVVATPIGNARDITLRALDTLRAADLIACEDTRVTRKLLNLYNIRTPTLAYHEHNAEKVRPRLLRQLRDGARIALVSDAGTPTISDPGYRLVREAHEYGLLVTPLPGASAVLTALAASGLPSDRFIFVGFPPAKKGARRSMLAELKEVRATLILFESASRLAATLADCAEVLGNREAMVGRELTKLHEEFRHGSLPELAAYYQSAPRPKGELVVLVRAAMQKESADVDEVRSMLAEAMTRGSLKDAVAEVAMATGTAKREVYALALTLRDDEKDS